MEKKGFPWTQGAGGERQTKTLKPIKEQDDAEQRYVPHATE